MSYIKSASKNKLICNYHFIPIKTKASWIKKDLIFFFQLGKRSQYEELIKSNYDDINQMCERNGFSFIFHKFLSQNENIVNHAFLAELASMDELKFYEELEWQIFTFQTIDPAYIVRRFNDDCFIVWGYDAFHRERKLVFPFESLLSLEDIFVGEHSQVNFWESRDKITAS